MDTMDPVEENNHLQQQTMMDSTFSAPQVQQETTSEEFSEDNEIPEDGFHEVSFQQDATPAAVSERYLHDASASLDLSDSQLPALDATYQQRACEAIKHGDKAGVLEILGQLGPNWCCLHPDFAGTCIAEAANLNQDHILQLLIRGIPQGADFTGLCDGNKSLADADSHHAVVVASVLQAICSYPTQKNGLKILDQVTAALLPVLPCLAGMTSLHLMAIGNNTSLLARAIAFGMDCAVKDALGCAPLHYAALFARKAAAQSLLAQGALHTATNAAGRMPLSLAAANGHEDLVHLLLKWNEKNGVGAFAVEREAEDALRLAAGNGHQKVVELLLDFDVVDLETPEISKAVLDAAVKKGHGNLVSLLLSRNVVVSPTSLHLAVQSDQVEVAFQLLNLSSEEGLANARVGPHGVTPLMVAASSGACKDMVQMLLDFGGDVTLRDAQGEGVLDCLDNNPRPDPQVVALLKGAFSQVCDYVEYKERFLISKTAPFWRDSCGGCVPAMDKAGNAVSIWFYRNQNARDRAACIITQLDSPFACTLAGTWDDCVFTDMAKQPQEPYALATTAGEKNLQETLLELHSSSRGLADSEARNIFTLLLACVEHVHSRGFVHHDLHPSNFIRYFDGCYRLFGFHNSYVEGERVVKGSHVEVCPPEVAHALSVDEPVTATPAADVWALGCLLYNLITSRCLVKDLVEEAAATLLGGGKVARNGEELGGVDAIGSSAVSPRSSRALSPRSAVLGTGGPLSARNRTRSLSMGPGASGSQQRQLARSGSLQPTSSLTAAANNSRHLGAHNRTWSGSVVSFGRSSSVPNLIPTGSGSLGGRKSGGHLPPATAGTPRSTATASSAATPRSNSGSTPTKGRSVWSVAANKKAASKKVENDPARIREEWMAFLAWQLEDKVVSRVLTRIAHKPSKLAQHAASLLRDMLQCNPARRCSLEHVRSHMFTQSAPRLPAHLQAAAAAPPAAGAQAMTPPPPIAPTPTAAGGGASAAMAAASMGQPRTTRTASPFDTAGGRLGSFGGLLLGGMQEDASGVDSLRSSSPQLLSTTASMTPRGSEALSPTGGMTARLPPTPSSTSSSFAPLPPLSSSAPAAGGLLAERMSSFSSLSHQHAGAAPLAPAPAPPRLGLAELAAAIGRQKLGLSPPAAAYALTASTAPAAATPGALSAASPPTGAAQRVAPVPPLNLPTSATYTPIMAGVAPATADAPPPAASLAGAGAASTASAAASGDQQLLGSRGTGFSYNTRRRLSSGGGSDATPRHSAGSGTFRFGVPKSMSASDGDGSGKLVAGAGGAGGTAAIHVMAEPTDAEEPSCRCNMM